MHAKNSIRLAFISCFFFGIMVVVCVNKTNDERFFLKRVKKRRTNKRGRHARNDFERAGEVGRFVVTPFEKKEDGKTIC